VGVADPNFAFARHANLAVFHGQGFQTPGLADDYGFAHVFSLPVFPVAGMVRPV